MHDFNSTIAKKVAKKIKEERIKKGITQEQLAEEIGVDVRTIQRMENATTPEPPKNIIIWIELARIFDTSIEELIR